VSQEDIKDAFAFLDDGNKGKISVADLKVLRASGQPVFHPSFIRPCQVQAKLSPFYPDMPTKEFQFLMGDKKFITRTLLAYYLRFAFFNGTSFLCRLGPGGIT